MIIRVSCFRLTHYKSSNFKNRLCSCFYAYLTVVLTVSRLKISGPWFSGPWFLVWIETAKWFRSSFYYFKMKNRLWAYFWLFSALFGFEIKEYCATQELLIFSAFSKPFSHLTYSKHTGSDTSLWQFNAVCHTL